MGAEQLHDVGGGSDDTALAARGVQETEDTPQVGPLIHAADGIRSMAVIVSGVDAEHHQVDHAHVQHLVHQPGRMGGQADVPDGSRLLELLNVLQYPAFQHRIQIRLGPI